jgi:hypothetical protein
MSEKPQKVGQGSSTARVTKVWCRRLEQQLPLAEHKECPFCFGKHEVGSAKHELFCDFKPGEDPTNFGFPEDKGRYKR